MNIAAQTPFFSENSYPLAESSFSSSPETFQWTKQWYPVAVAEFLDPSRPHKIQLLGKDLVLWRDNWRCQTER
jgi:phenylpropionate dioxygenase-like ring-hydroxylating dioxygenase large terminal subunit